MTDAILKVRGIRFIWHTRSGHFISEVTGLCLTPVCSESRKGEVAWDLASQGGPTSTSEDLNEIVVEEAIQERIDELVRVKTDADTQLRKLNMQLAEVGNGNGD